MDDGPSARTICMSCYERVQVSLRQVVGADGVIVCPCCGHRHVVGAADLPDLARRWKLWRESGEHLPETIAPVVRDHLKRHQHIAVNKT